MNVTPTGTGGLNPNLLVYNKGDLVQYTDSYWNPATHQQEIHTTVSLTAGQTYAFVVGSAGGIAVGNTGSRRRCPSIKFRAP